MKFLRNLFEIVTCKNIENFNEMTLILKECKVSHTEGRELLFAALEVRRSCIMFFFGIEFRKFHFNFSTFILAMARIRYH